MPGARGFFTAVAVVLAAVLAAGMGAYQMQQAPLTVACGTVNGGQSWTAAGVKHARAAGAWLYRMAGADAPTGPDTGAYIEGVGRDVLWYWAKAFWNASQGQPDDPEVARLEAEFTKAAEDANTQCTPCPMATAPGGSSAEPNVDAMVGAPTDTTSVSSRSSGSSREAVVRAAAARYFPASEVDKATAIAMAESSGNPDPPNPPVVGGGTMRGLWQINDGAHPDLVRGRNWRDPNVNAWMAYQVWKDAGKSWRPWSTYNSGSYKSHLSTVSEANPNTPSVPQPDDDGPTDGQLEQQPGTVSPDSPTAPDDTTPTPGCATGTGGPDATIATWNPNGGNSEANVRKGVAALAKTSSVIGLQEMGGARWHGVIMSALPAGWAMVGQETSQPIVYDGNKYAPGVVYSEPVLANDMAGFGYGARYIVAVQLRDKSTGQTFYVMNTHLWPHATKGQAFATNDPKRVEHYRDHMDALVRKVDEYRANGSAVIVTGDFNAGFDPWGLMSQHGLQSNWQTLGRKATAGKSTLDYIWTSGAAPASQRLVGTFGSDHRAVEVTYVGSAPNTIDAADLGGSSGSGASVWPVPGHATGTYPGHDGVDINGAPGDGNNDAGDPIVAPQPCKVTHTGTGKGYGQAIFCQTFDGYRMVFGHTSRIVVHVGQTVAAGEKIGEVGSTGKSSAAHLHFGVFPGGTTKAALAFLNRKGKPGGSQAVVQSGSRTVTDPTSHLTYKIPIPAGPRGVAVNFALDQLGEPYSHGANHGPNSWDCSGLVGAAWAKAGVKFTWQTGVMLRQVPRTGSPKIGDMPTTNSHTQMYLGKINGQTLILEASRPGTDVRIVRQWMTPTAYLDATKLGAAA